MGSPVEEFDREGGNILVINFALENMVGTKMAWQGRERKEEGLSDRVYGATYEEQAPERFAGNSGILGKAVL